MLHARIGSALELRAEVGDLPRQEPFGAEDWLLKSSLKNIQTSARSLQTSLKERISALDERWNPFHRRFRTVRISWVHAESQSGHRFFSELLNRRKSLAAASVDFKLKVAAQPMPPTG